MEQNGIETTARYSVTAKQCVASPMESTMNNICQDMIATYRAKNADYGDSFGQTLKEFGLISAVVRLNDKMNRLKSLVKLPDNRGAVANESFEDTLLDMASYSIMTLSHLRHLKQSK